MTNQLWGPFQPLPDCRLWLSEDHIGFHSWEPELHRGLAEARLSNQDLERWSRYRPHEKKRQFLNSRLAIRAVLQREFGIDSESFRVETMETGQPTLKHAGQHTLASISLSHTGNITAIVLSDKYQRLGVDIEIVQPLNVRTFSLTFLNRLEHEWLTREALAGSSEMTLAIWTLKEALWKTLGGPGDTGMSEIVADYHNSAATQFFGHRFSFPCALTNYSSIDGLDSQIPSFIGCIVVMDRDTPDGPQYPRPR
jgi:phosphopantetheinyl transferase